MNNTKGAREEIAIEIMESIVLDDSFSDAHKRAGAIIELVCQEAQGIKCEHDFSTLHQDEYANTASPNCTLCLQNKFVDDLCVRLKEGK